MSDMDVKQFVFKKGAANRIPVSGTFELTSRCNFRCKMCYIQMSNEEQCAVGRELTTAEWLGIAQEAVRSGMIYLLLTGGEPLLRPDFIELYTKLVQMGVLVSVNTNGSLITPEIVECFRQFPPEKINISLYGTSSLRYGRFCGNAKGYEKAVQGIRMLKRAGIRVNLNTTFTRENRDDMESLIEFAKQEKIPIRTAGYLFPSVRNGHEEQADTMTSEEMGITGARFDYLTMDAAQGERRAKYISKCLNDTSAEGKQAEAKRAACMAGKGAFWISWDGMMYSCGMLSHASANVLEIGFTSAWESTKEAAKNLWLPSECSVCKYQKLCPSCAAVSQCVNNEQGILVPEMCKRTQSYVQTFLELMMQTQQSAPKDSMDL